MPCLTPNQNLDYRQEADSNFIISLEDVLKRLSSLHKSKSTGPDGIPAWILKEFCDYLAPPVCHLFNASIQSGFIPQIWKSAYMIYSLT